MKKIIALFAGLTVLQSFAQNADISDMETILPPNRVIVHKDDRLDVLGEKQAEINLFTARMNARSAWGYRLQVLSTNDRDLAMKTKSQLLQRFPEQKTYMFFQLPYVKLRFGNFKTKQEAESYKKQISRMLGGASIYYVAERIEVKPEKEKEEE